MNPYEPSLRYETQGGVSATVSSELALVLIIMAFIGLGKSTLSAGSPLHEGDPMFMHILKDRSASSSSGIATTLQVILKSRVTALQYEREMTKFYDGLGKPSTC